MPFSALIRYQTANGPAYGDLIDQNADGYQIRKLNRDAHGDFTATSETLTVTTVRATDLRNPRRADAV